MKTIANRFSRLSIIIIKSIKMIFVLPRECVDLYYNLSFNDQRKFDNTILWPYIAVGAILSVFTIEIIIDVTHSGLTLKHFLYGLLIFLMFIFSVAFFRHRVFSYFMDKSISKKG